MLCPKCNHGFCIDCEEPLGPFEFRCPKCLDIYEEQRRKDLESLRELEDGPTEWVDKIVAQALEAVKPTLIDYVHRAYLHGRRHKETKENTP